MTTGGEPAPARIALRTAAAVGLGIVLPLSFTQQLHSYSLHQSPSQIACLYVIAAAVYVLLAIVTCAPAVFLRPLSEKAACIADEMASGAWLAYFGVSLGYLCAQWLASFAGVAGPPSNETHWAATSLAILLVLQVAIFRKRKKLQKISWIKGAATTAVQLGLGFLLVAIVISARQFTGSVGPTVEHAESSAVCGATGRKRPNIFLISLDSLAANDMSLYGYRRETTPFINEFASRSYVFDRFYAPSNFTTPGIASLLTGARPWTHRVYHLYGMPRRDAIESTLPKSLHACGYFTAAFVANGLAHPKSHGLARDFDYLPGNYLHDSREVIRDALAVSPRFSGQSLIDLYPLPQLVNWYDAMRRRTRADSAASSSERQIQDALRLVTQQRRGAERPVFVWLHLYPPHHFYMPPAPYRNVFDATSRFTTYESQDLTFGFYPPKRKGEFDVLRARYDENLRWVDHLAGRYIKALDDLGVLDDSLVILTADHGESFEHGYWGHIGPMLYEDLIRIPLVLKMPKQRQALRVDRVAELIDVYPTVLDAIGAPAPEGLEGRSLLPIVAGRGRRDATAVAMQLDASSALGRATQGTIAVVSQRYKLIRHLPGGDNDEEFYDLTADPHETRNLRPEDSEDLRAMQAIADRIGGRRLGNPDDYPSRTLN